jgi:hypothetical protein
MSDLDPPAHSLPAIVIACLTSPGAPGQGSWVRAQVTSYAGSDVTASDTLYCSLLLNDWELTVCMDSSHAELFSCKVGATIAMRRG